MIFNRIENGSTARVLNKKEDLSMTKICQLERFMDCSLLSLQDFLAIGFARVGTTHVRKCTEYTRVQGKKGNKEGKEKRAGRSENKSLRKMLTLKFNTEE